MVLSPFGSRKASEFNTPTNGQAWRTGLPSARPLLTIALFVKLGLYRAVTRFVSTRVLTAAAFGSLISAVLFCLTTLIFERKLHLALPIVYFLLLVVCITSSRMILRAILTDRHKNKWCPSSFTAQDNPAANCWKPSNRSTNIPPSPLWTTTPKSAAPSSTT